MSAGGCKSRPQDSLVRIRYYIIYFRLGVISRAKPLAVWRNGCHLNPSALQTSNFSKLESMMKMEFLLVLLVLVSFAVARKEGLVGGWSRIKNINDPQVTEIADFAVSEYDKRSGAKLKLVKVIKGDTQVVAGTNFRLVLSASDGSSANNYEAVVWDKPWQHYRNLTSFTPLHT
ncbi:hypothetical protein RJT34_29660 [Clitoria ternatea]|uniref:Cystatin domain-containing protein n=1 Tax=Clitoria ternatea TaxID=43366 RepID=A0AAN9ET42_CLITE